MNRDKFKNPEDIFRGTDFWMLNDRLTEDGIKRQISEMNDKGVHSFIARTYIGLKSDYPGQDFMSKMHIIVDAAKKYGMKVFLQAGYMPEAVVGLPEDHALRYILPVGEGEVNGRRIFCRHGEYCFVEHNSRTFLDMFDPDAVDYYLKKSYEEMWADFVDEYGKTILSVWVDEPSYNGMYLPFTPRLEELWRERFGGEFADEVWKLFFDADDAKTVRYRYRVLLRDLLEDNYFKKVRAWCNAHDLLFSGHLMMEETLSSQICRAGACMPYYKYFDIPGIDVLCGEMNWIDDPIQPSDPGTVDQNYRLYNTAMQCVSAARQSGQKHILAEMYGVTTENMGFRNMLNMFDSYAAMGISHRSVHGIFYSLRGRGKRAYPPHISYYQPFWAKYKNITDYCARVGEFISDGRTEGDIAIVHPLETGYMLYHGKIGDTPAGGAEKYDRKLYLLLKYLKNIHRDPELCDLATLRDMGEAKDGRLIVGEMSYSTVILPDLGVITSELESLLRDFTNGGGRLIILGEKPSMLDGLPDDKLGERLAGLPGALCADDLIGLGRLISADRAPYRLTGSGAQDILVNRRVTESGTSFFLYNDDCAHNARATLEVDGKRAAFVCCGFDGSIKPYPAEFDGRVTKIPVCIDCGGSLMLSVEDGEPIGIPETKPVRVLELGDGWQALPETPNVLLLESFSYSTDGKSFSEPLPTVAIQKLLTDADYHGELTLRCEIRSAADLSGLTLALEEPREQRVFIDGREISEPDGYFLEEAFEKIKLGSLAVGTHLLEIKREFCPLSKFKSSITSLFETQLGVELEPMYLLGDFTVRTTAVSSRSGCSVCEPDFVLAKDDILCDGELTTAGYPFFAGEMTLKKRFTLGKPGKARLRVGVMNAGVGEAYLNGVKLGDLNRAPAELDCADAMLDGENVLEIKLFTTLRNIIGPFHRPRGDIGNHFGGGYQNPDAAWLSADTSVEGWQHRLNDADRRWTNCFELTRFGIGDVEIVSE